MPRDLLAAQSKQPRDLLAEKNPDDGGFMGDVRAFTGAAIESVPIAGPYIRQGADWMRSKVHGGTPEEQSAETERLQEASPISNISGGVTGAVVPLLGLGGTALGAKALGVTGRNLATRSAASAGSGAAIGGADAAARGGDIEQGAITGGLFGSVAPAAGQAVGRAVGSMLGRSSAPATQDLRAMKDAAYAAVDQSGVRYAKSSFNQLASDITAKMQSLNLSPFRHPKAASMVADIQKLTGAAPTITQLDQLRQTIARDVANAPDGAERFFGKKMLEEVDKFIDSAPTTVSGNSGDAAALVTKARELNTRWRKASTVDEAVTKAERRAASTGSGGNADNATRQNIRAILDNPRKSRGFSGDERAAMERVVRGTRGQNAFRLAGKLSPQGSGLMAALGLGATVANPMMAIAPATGMMAKALAERGTTQNVRRLSEMVRSGGPVAAPMSPSTQRLVQALLQSEGTQLPHQMDLQSLLRSSSALVPR